jgi:hypothetical protein
MDGLVFYFAYKNKATVATSRASAFIAEALFAPILSQAVPVLLFLAVVAGVAGAGSTRQWDGA